MKRVFVGMLACMMVLGLLVSGAALADTPTGTPVSTWKELSDALREGTESAYYLTKDLYDSTYGIMVVPNG